MHKQEPMQIEPGQKAHYTNSGTGKTENGIVKSISPYDTIFVASRCNNEWNNYYNYTGCGTRPEDLSIGWKET